MIAHHVTDAQLLEYTAGTLRDAEALLVACHLTLCPACRARQATLEAVGGTLLERVPPADVPQGLLDATLQRLDTTVPTPGPTFDPDGVLPWPLAARVGSFQSLPWRRRFPGVEEIRIDGPAEPGLPARLYRFPAGGFIPAHQHVGDEVSLVLTGAFTDDDGRFARGDVCVRDQQGIHQQRIEEGEACVVLVVADGPFRPRSVVAWLASMVAGF